MAKSMTPLNLQVERYCRNCGMAQSSYAHDRIICRENPSTIAYVPFSEVRLYNPAPVKKSLLQRILGILEGN